jgi:hypothetical protein
MSIHGHWDAGSEESALEAGVIDALHGGQWRPPADFPDAYNWAFHDAKKQLPERPREERGSVEAHQLAILGLVHLAIFADRQADAAEISWLYEEARSHPVFAGVPFNAYRSACMMVLQDMRERPLLELMEIWASMARPHAREAIVLAAGVMLADGVVAQTEEGYLTLLIEKLGVSQAEASAILRDAFGAAS